MQHGPREPIVELEDLPDLPPVACLVSLTQSAIAVLRLGRHGFCAVPEARLLVATGWAEPVFVRLLGRDGPPVVLDLIALTDAGREAFEEIDGRTAGSVYAWGRVWDALEPALGDSDVFEADEIVWEHSRALNMVDDVSPTFLAVSIASGWTKGLHRDETSTVPIQDVELPRTAPDPGAHRAGTNRKSRRAEAKRSRAASRKM